MFVYEETRKTRAACSSLKLLVFVTLVLLCQAGCGKGENISQMTIPERLHSNDPDIRANAVLDLWDSKRSDKVQLLIEALSDPHPSVRGQAAWLLSELKPKEAAPALIQVLNDENPYVRGFAADTLGELGTKEAIEPLIEVMGLRLQVQKQEGPVEQVDNDILSIHDALKKLTGKNFELDAAKWEEWYESTKKDNPSESTTSKAQDP